VTPPAVSTTPPRLPLLVLAAALALGWNLGGHHFLDPDEGRNAEVAREMALSNDYLLPHLDGLPYLDKPVVYFAAAAAVMEVLGPTEAAARLPAYLATLATIALVAWFARRRWGAAAGWTAALALASMPMVAAYARTTIFDSTLSLCTTAAILAFAEERPALAWAAIGLGTLTKGPVAIAIPLCALVPWSLLTGESLRRLFPWRALLAFGIVALPWFILVSIRVPDFPHYVFIRETLQRVTTRSFHRTAPFWYYLPILPVAAFPWIVPALARLGGGRWRWAWLARREHAGAREPLLLACWVLGPLLFFTLNQSKLPQYVLPLMPAIALAAARAMARDGAQIAWKTTAALTAALGALLVSLTVWLPAPISLTAAERAVIPPTALALGLVLLASSAALWIGGGGGSGRPTLTAAGYAAGVIALPLVSGPLLRAVGDDRSAFALAAVVRDHGAVVGVSAYPPSLPFYLQNRVFVATETGRELTSNYIADHVEQMRYRADSPLLTAAAWRRVLERCTGPVVFVTRNGDRDSRRELAHLPLLYEDGHYAAYGPCTPHPLVRQGVR
jgi:4-amino-4-deoxy-L-arabinose transferase-like glycosyltransferase